MVPDPISGTIFDMTYDHGMPWIERLRDQHLAGPNLKLCHLIRGCITCDDGRPLGLRPVGVWLQGQLTILISTAMDGKVSDQERRDAVVLLEQILVMVTNMMVPDDMTWLFRVGDRYYGQILRGSSGSDANYPGSCLYPGYFLEMLLEISVSQQNPSLLVWAAESHVPASRRLWRRVCEAVIEYGEDHEFNQIIAVVNEGKIAIDAIGLFYEAYQSPCCILETARLDPTSCSQIRNNLSYIISCICGFRQASEFRELLEYATTIHCPCARIMGQDDLLEPIHSGPLEIYEMQNRILGELINLNRIEADGRGTPVIADSLARYSRDHDLPVLYYLVGDLVILIKNPGLSEQDAAWVSLSVATRKKHLDQLSITHQGTEINAISLTREAITPEMIIAACREIGSKRAE
jgi:hypothetical protein